MKHHPASIFRLLFILYGCLAYIQVNAMQVNGINYPDTLPISTAAPKTTAYVYAYQEDSTYNFWGEWNSIQNSCQDFTARFCSGDSYSGYDAASAPYVGAYWCRTSNGCNTTGTGALVYPYCPYPYAAYLKSGSSYNIATSTNSIQGGQYLFYMVDAAECIDPNATNIMKSDPKGLGNDPSSGYGVDREVEQAQCGVGNPVMPTNGNKYQVEPDYEESGQFPLKFIRYYNSLSSSGSGQIGEKWRHIFDRSIVQSGSTATVNRHDGKQLKFRLEGSNWVGDVDVADKLIRTTAGWEYKTIPEDELETYDATGKLLSIANRSGLVLVLFYDGTGRLASVTHSLGGERLQFSRDETGRISAISLPSGQSIQYQYDVGNNLSLITYPDQVSRGYHYDEPDKLGGGAAGHLLTGITDESGVRFATWTYDSLGRAVSSEHADGTERFALSYTPDSTQVTDPVGAVKIYNFVTMNGAIKSTGESQPAGAGCSAAAKTIDYDANGNLAGRTNFNGFKKIYTHDLARNLEGSRTEGLNADGTVRQETRTVTTTWHPTWTLPVRVEEFAGASAAGSAIRRTEYSYDAYGNVIEQKLTDPTSGKTRAWTSIYTYSPTFTGAILQRIDDGPRVDVTDRTTSDYWAPDATCPGGGAGYDKGCRGRVKKITNALGHIIQYTRYNPHGQVEEMIDFNGIAHTFNYDARQRLTTETVDGRATQYSYNAWGGMERQTLPDGSFIAYQYDAAHRLIGKSNPSSQSFSIGLDQSGKPVEELYLNADDSLVKERYLGRDALGRIAQDISGDNASIRTFGYHPEGELKSVSTASGDTSSYEINAYGQPIKRVDPVNGTAKPSLFNYDPLGRLTQATKANASTTSFQFDGLDLISEMSVERGAITFEYDTAGNTKKKIDARGLGVMYQYDALNRVTQIDYPGNGGIGSSTVKYIWDTAAGCSRGVGKLCQMQDGSGTTTFDYDVLGNVITQTRTEAGETFVVHQAYNEAGRATDLITPTGEVIVPTLDESGRTSGLSSTSGTTTTKIADGIAYSAAEQVTAQVLGQASETQSFDTAGRVVQTETAVAATGTDATGDAPIPLWAVGMLGVALAGIGSKYNKGKAVMLLIISAAAFCIPVNPAMAADISVTYDENGNVATRTTPSGATTFTYDQLEQINTEAGPNGNLDHDFDAGGNRTSDGSNTTVTYASNSDRVATINGTSASHDAAGNLLNDGTYKYVWNAAGQLVELRRADNALIAQYYYDYRNLRTRKVTTALAPQGIATVFYHYDSQGRLLAETVPGNQPIATYIWNRDRLTGYIVHQPNRTVYTVQNDALGSPFQVRTTGGQVVWRWESEAFGKTLPNEDVDGNGTKVTLNLRFPGQYYDRESSLHYNWHRYYSPKLGRYISPDPIGLAGGDNLYSYVGGNPLSRTDPRGLFWWIPLYYGAVYATELTLAAITVAEIAGGVPNPVTTPAATVGKAVKNAAQQCYLYQKLGANGEHLKYGITNNPATRYTQEELAGGRLKILAEGERQQMLQLERGLHETLPIGPQEAQRFYIQKQIEQGLIPPPYP